MTSKKFGVKRLQGQLAFHLPANFTMYLLHAIKQH